ncbi:MAG: pirin family protein [Myxococcota bacterium]|nr:pirin family protein [Myxococcota bacterium]
MTGRSRTIRLLHQAHHQLEGAGFVVRRPFPGAGLPSLDPFLLLDEMGPKDWAAGEAVGAPDHPHRGFETVTYLLEGAVEHRDSEGHHGVLRPGDVQWMTAGSGVIHSELPPDDFLARGGTIHGFQLWVNLPAADKMMAPRYQEVPREEIPLGRSDDGVTVRVLAGEALGASALIDTRIPITYQHWTLPANRSFFQPIAPTHCAFVYLFSGRILLGEGAAVREVTEGQIAVLECDGSGVLVTGPKDQDRDSELLLLSGQPIGEPIAWHGPFVMNTREQIHEAIRDYQQGHFVRSSFDETAGTDPPEGV